MSTSIENTETLDQSISRLQNEIYEKDKEGGWTPDAVFFKWRDMSSDARGKLGESVVVDALSRLLYLLTTVLDIEWDGDKSIKKDGKYDIKLIVKALYDLTGVRIEVKTSTSDTIQMDNIYLQDQWDIVVGLLVTQETINFIVLDKSKTENNIDQILVPEVKKHPLLGVGACLRDEKEDAFKLDISMPAMAKAINAGLAFSYVFGKTSEASLLEFFKDRLSICTGIEL